MQNPQETRHGLSHLDDHGNARMVDVSTKPVTPRRAVAEARVRMAAATLDAILRNNTPKGDVIGTARIAGIQAAKRTAELIPLCHPLPIDAVSIEIDPVPPDEIRIIATCVVQARTGVEMEALTAASIAALTIYDMAKAIDRGMEIGTIRLLQKSGGQAGTWTRPTSE
jgi:cyclic pyranopterin monophosphate synthase